MYENHCKWLYGRYFYQKKLSRKPMESSKREFKGKDRMSVELNHYLEITRSHVHQIYRELETSDKVITVDLVRKLFYGVDEDNKTLLQVFREHNEQSRKLIGKDFVSKTVQRYETTTRYLEEFIKKEYQLSDIALNNLEANFISKFDAFLKIEKVVRRIQLSPD